MAKYVMVVESQPVEGRDAEYNAWYDSEHFQDVLDLPGVQSGRRFDLAMGLMGEPGLPYLAIYEIETDDIGLVAAELGKRSADGTMRQSETLDRPSTVLRFYRQH